MTAQAMDSDNFKLSISLLPVGHWHAAAERYYVTQHVRPANLNLSPSSSPPGPPPSK